MSQLRMRALPQPRMRALPQSSISKAMSLGKALRTHRVRSNRVVKDLRGRGMAPKRPTKEAAAPRAALAMVVMVVAHTETMGQELCKATL